MTVIDTKFVANANGPLSARKSGNILDRRLCVLERIVRDRLPAMVNKKLIGEYRAKVASQGFRNEAVMSFFTYVVDHGVDSGRSTLSSPDYSKLRDCRWPSHDQHVIAACGNARQVEIQVTEAAHEKCAAAIKREFSHYVIRLK